MFRFFCDKDDFDGDYIFLKGENAKHLNIVRCKIGEKVVVCDGFLNDYICTVEEINKNYVKLEIIEKTLSNGEPNVKITLFQSLPKNDKMEYIIQKTVEIGAVKIVPFESSFCVKKPKKSLRERFLKISEAAAKQCGRGIIPDVSEVVSLEEAITLSKNLDYSFVAYENEENRALKDMVSLDKGKNIGVFIGPEGGFSSEEIKVFERNNIIPVTLGKRILRAETAGFCAVTLILYILGEM